PCPDRERAGPCGANQASNRQHPSREADRGGPALGGPQWAASAFSASIADSGGHDRQDRRRRPHIAGALGAALTKRYFDLGWMERMRRSHAVIVTRLGRRGFQETFGIDAPEPGDRMKR